MKTYQDIFNETLTKIRYAISGAVYDNAPLMKTIVKVMYNFSDELIENGIIEDREQRIKVRKEWKKQNGSI